MNKITMIGHSNYVCVLCLKNYILTSKNECDWSLQRFKINSFEFVKVSCPWYLGELSLYCQEFTEGANSRPMIVI